MPGYFLIGLYLELICLYAYASPLTQHASAPFTMSTKGLSGVTSTITIFPNGPNKSSTPTNLQNTKRMSTSTTSTTPTTTTTTTPTSKPSLPPFLLLTTRTQPTITTSTTTTSTTTVVVGLSSAATAMPTTMRSSIAATSMTVPLQTSSQMRSTTTVQKTAFTTKSITAKSTNVPAPTKGTNTFSTFISAITTVSNTKNTRSSETAQSPPGHYERLIEDIFKGYDKKIMPFSNENIPVTIAETVLGCILVQVVEKSQIASYVITRKQNWTDPRFQWNPAKYGGIQNILVPANDIWLADVFNYNNKDMKDLLSDEQDWANIRHDGKVSYTTSQYIQAVCKILVHRFPFDTQFCTLSLSSNMMDNKKFKFVPLSVNFMPRAFVGNAEWAIENISINSHIEPEDGIWGEKGYVFQYVLQLKRSPTFYITVIVIPTFFITAVSIVGVFSPGTEHEPGDVANLGLSALLALMLLLSIISEKLPKSEEMSLLGIYILVILGFFVLSILLEMASLYYFQKMSQSGERPPQWLYKAALFGIWKTKNKEIRAAIKKRIWPGEKRKESNVSQSSNNSFFSFTNAKSTSTISSTRSKKSDFKIELKKRSKESPENGLKSPKNLLRKIFIKKAFSNNEKDFNKWKNIIGDLNSKREEQQRKIQKEWDMIEARMDFIWIAIFETFNLLNLLSLVWFAALPSLDMKHGFESV